MHCILHIGTEKTGTTSLQEFFHLNRSYMAEHGYLYTKTAGFRNNRLLSIAAYNKDRRDDFTMENRIKKDKDLILYQKNIIRNLRSELNRVKGYHTVIFSSEHFQSRLTTNEELLRLKSILKGLRIRTIQIVVYLRSPAEIAKSLHSTAVISGSTKANPPGPENNYWRNVCDHRDTLLRFRNTFHSDTIIPRIFSKADLVNGSIIDDFIFTIGLQVSKENCTIPKPKNESISIIALELLRRINKEIPMFRSGNQPNPDRGKIVSYILEHLKDGQRYEMSKSLCRKYEEYFKESNEWVRSEYFPNRTQMFNPNNATKIQKTSVEPYEIDQLAKMVSEMWLDNSKSNLMCYRRRQIQPKPSFKIQPAQF